MQLQVLPHLQLCSGLRVQNEIIAVVDELDPY